MAGYTRFWPAISDEFQLGSTPEEAFQNICKKRGLNAPSYKTVSGLMDRFYDNDFITWEDEGEFYEKLRSAIIGQYMKFTRAMSLRKTLGCSVETKILNSRFALDVSNRLDSLEIADLFNSESRKLQIAPFEKTTTCERTMAQIAHDLVLISGLYNGMCRLFLLQIDFATQKGSILDTTDFEFLGSHVITDSMNCREVAYLDFGEWEEDEFERSYGAMYRGHVVDNRIIVDKRIEFNCNLFLRKLDDGKIFGFRVVDELDGDFDWQFCEFSLDADGNFTVKSRTVEYPDFFDPREVCSYIWAKNKLYMCNRKGQSFVIAVFDAETFKWSSTKYAGLSYYQELSIDENGILSVSAGERIQQGEVTTIYRFPMKKPDKLKYLAWATIRRGSLFFGSKLHDRLLPRLPFNSEFNPFSENYVYDI